MLDFGYKTRISSFIMEAVHEREYEENEFYLFLASCGISRLNLEFKTAMQELLDAGSIVNGSGILRMAS